MKLKRDILGVVLAFMSAGFVATGMNADAYQEVYDTQAKQEQKVQQAINSEFIMPKDKQALQQTVVAFDKAKTKENRHKLQEKITTQEKLLSEVSNRLAKKEAQTALKESDKVKDDLAELKEKSQESFIVAKDEQQVENLSNELTKISPPQKVEPVRDLATKTTKLATEMTNNQAEMLRFVTNLKKDNKTAATLQKHKYLTKTNKAELVELQKENEKYFDDADDFSILQNRLNNSSDVLTTIQNHIKETEKDFKENEKNARELIKKTNDLLAKGDLKSDEKAELNQIKTVLKDALDLKNYHPGDLANNYAALKTSYDNFDTVNNERKAETKRKVEEAARKEAAERKAAQEKSAQEGDNNSANNEIPAPTPSAGGWHQAPPGYKFLKVESGKTYGQVKNPNNFRQITVAEAANYTPGHGNGSAKQ